jgi:hypothetical protein
MTATTFLVFYRFKAMSKEEKGKVNGVKLKIAYPLELNLWENMFMHGELSIMDSCYLRLRVLIHFWTGGQTLRIL